MVFRNREWRPAVGDLIEPELDSQGKIRLGAYGRLPEKSAAGAHEDGGRSETEDAVAVPPDPSRENAPMALLVNRREGVGPDVDAPVIDGIFRGDMPVTFKMAGGYDAPVSFIKHALRDQHRFHGKALLPKGYSWGPVPDQAKIRWAEHDREAEPGRLVGGPHDLSSNYNWIQSLVALFQVGSAGLTLYKARGTQIQRYGYAAFGLTVVPYLVMSILNLVAQIATADYPNVFMVSSPLMDEARRHGGVFDGVVGHLGPPPRDDDDGAQPVYEVRAEVEPRAIRVAAYPSIDRYPRPMRGGGLLAVHYFILPILLGCLSLVLIGALSRFGAGESSSAQRGWTMAWLAVGIGCGWWADMVMGAFIPRRDQNTGKIGAAEYIGRVIGGCMGCSFFCIPAIGGFVVVGEMLRDYGVCDS